MATTAFPFRLDHVSVTVPHLAEAVDHLERRLGLRAIVSAADPERHSRVYLDRSYLEVASHPDSGDWHAPLFFLGFDDPKALRSHLDASGLDYRFGEYTGVDGRWDDVEILTQHPPVPILVRRTHPPEVAADWPPAIGQRHRCSAHQLAAVHVAVADLAASVETYRRLLGLDTPPPSASRAGGRATVRLPLAAGDLVLVEGEPIGISGIVLGVTSLETAAAVSGCSSRAADDGISWLDSAVTFGLPIGFVEATEPDRDAPGSRPG